VPRAKGDAEGRTAAKSLSALGGPEEKRATAARVRGASDAGDASKVGGA